MGKLHNIFELSAEIGRSVREVRTFQQKGIIPFLKLGHRTHLYDLAKVQAALAAYEIPAVAAKQNKRARALARRPIDGVKE
jgi:hypothetical protein